MSYSAPRLLEIFGVGHHSAKITEVEARTLARNPALIAERVYGLGNPTKARELGNTNPGDGFRYRGGGLMQTTGRANYRATGQRCRVPFEDSPDLIVSAEHALKPALIEWTNGNLNAFADADDILSISRVINLGNAKTKRMPNGFEDRQARFKKVRPLCDGVSFPSGTRGPGVTRGRTRSANVEAPLNIVPAETAEPAPVVWPEVLELQRRLAAMQLYVGGVDGLFGPSTKTAIGALFLNQAVKNSERWPDERIIIAEIFPTAEDRSPNCPLSRLPEMAQPADD